MYEVKEKTPEAGAISALFRCAGGMEAKLLTFLTSLSVRQRLRFPLVVAFCLDLKQTNQFEDTKPFLRS